MYIIIVLLIVVTIIGISYYCIREFRFQSLLLSEQMDLLGKKINESYDAIKHSELSVVQRENNLHKIGAKNAENKAALILESEFDKVDEYVGGENDDKYSENLFPRNDTIVYSTTGLNVKAPIQFSSRETYYSSNPVIHTETSVYENTRNDGKLEHCQTEDSEKLPEQVTMLVGELVPETTPIDESVPENSLISDTHVTQELRKDSSNIQKNKETDILEENTPEICSSENPENPENNSPKENLKNVPENNSPKELNETNILGAKMNKSIILSKDVPELIEAKTNEEASDTLQKEIPNEKTLDKNETIETRDEDEKKESTVSQPNTNDTQKFIPVVDTDSVIVSDKDTEGYKVQKPSLTNNGSKYSMDKIFSKNHTGKHETINQHPDELKKKDDTNYSPKKANDIFEKTTDDEINDDSLENSENSAEPIVLKPIGSYSIHELKKIAKDYGFTVSNKSKKVELYKILKNHFDN